MHLAPAGITLRELIDEYCGGMLDGHELYGYLPGGASGGILPASLADVPLDFDTLQPHGCFIGSAAIVVLSDRDKAAGAAQNLMRFFRDESCGQCTPCRVGTAKALALMGERRWNRPLLEELSQAMMDASICGLGPGGAQPGAFRDEILSARGELMERASTDQIATMPIEFKLDGRTVVGRPDETIIETAARHGVEIPRLCYKPGLRPDGNCRACVVEIKGERVLAPSCCRIPRPGMEVTTDSPRARTSQKMVLELLLSDMPETDYRLDSELDQWAKKLDLGLPRFPARAQPAADVSHPAIAVNLDACIQCTRCLRACREEQVNDVIGYACRGEHSKIVFDFDDPMGESTCVACGECVQACPTGALMPARGAGLAKVDKTVESLCPFCGVGCQLTYHVGDNQIRFVTGRDGPANHGRLCVKGRYGFDYVHHPHRLTKPLIRKPGVAKGADFVVDPANWSEVFREATWEEALDFAGKA